MQTRLLFHFCLFKVVAVNGSSHDRVGLVWLPQTDTLASTNLRGFHVYYMQFA
ncbi:hypothetical protein GLYMA_05G149850v4 [Glycine max]|nr:hypothetical protein GLYMA_05G149850v4 [Glycine max]KAH1134491.1 hypothetical protein GYH30_012720 [Glycine max]